VQLAPLSATLTHGYGRNGYVQLDWKVVGTPTRLLVYRGNAVALTCPSSKCTKNSFTGNGTWTDTGLANGHKYTYRIELIKGSRASTSRAYSVVPIGPPTGVSAVGVSAGVTVTWTAPGAGVTKYLIWRGTTANFTDKATISLKTVSANATSWTDPNPVPGTAYYYFVVADSLHGNAISAPPPSPATHVLPPANLSTAATDGTVTLRWTSGGTGVTGFNVYRSTSSSLGSIVTGANRIATDLGSTMGKVPDPNLSNGTRYYYVVEALASGGSADSAVISGTPIAEPLVSGQSIDNFGNVTLSWTPSNDSTVTKYFVFRGNSAAAATAAASVSIFGSGSVGSVASSLHTWTDTHTNNGTTYFYVVQAWYSLDNGTIEGDAESVPVSATPDPPSAVQNLDSSSSFGAVALTWSDVDPNATSLIVFRSDSAGDLGTQLATLNDPSVQTYIDAGPLDPGDYFYTVRSVDAGGYQDAQVMVSVGP
jgi:hypothetical protein